ncbi:hypothetical protein [Maricaulis parjimensis]|uniref:hypothetical protein n=1 Tax=Maricaulis parjimensis TaxID=144023 RepID=UPI00193AB85E|nr:hypothetical protein [Maricaulis parjimensis]
MAKFWLAATALSGALLTSGCVIVVGDDDDGNKMRHTTRSSDGYIVLDRDGDYSRLSGDLKLRGRLGGDLSLVSGDVEIDNMNIGGDVSIAAGDVDFTGSVDGETSIAGGDVNFNGRAGDELSLAAGDLDVRGQIDGRAALAAGDMLLEAAFNDGLTASAGTMRMSGEVHGRMVLTAINEMRRNRDYRGDEGRIVFDGNAHDGGEICAISVVFESGARIDGPLVVYAQDEPDVRSGAQVPGLEYRPRNRRHCDDLIDD